MAVDWSEAISDWNERMAALAAYEALAAAERSLADAQFEATSGDDLDERLAPIEAEYQRRLGDLRAWYHAAREAATGERGWAEQEAAVEHAREAYYAHPELMIDDDEAITCAVSGAPLYEDDIAIEVGDSWILASVYVPTEVIERLLLADQDALDEAA